MLNDPLAAALSMILNREKVAKLDCIIKPTSKLICNVFSLLKKHGYIEDFKLIEDGKGGYLQLKSSGNINNLGVIKPRFSVERDEFEKYEKRFLPGKDIGILIISTSKGLMTHIEAKEKKLGGKLIAFCY